MEVPPPIRVSKAGKYYYINFKNILSQLKLDDSDHKRVFEIERSEYMTLVMYKLTLRQRVTDKSGTEPDEQSQ